MIKGDALLENVVLPLALLDRLMPMHVFVQATGHVHHAGRTLMKICGAGLIGARFLEVFEARRPRGIALMSDLLSVDTMRLNLRLRSHPEIRLKGQGLSLPGKAGLLANLAFSSAVPEAVTAFGLTSRDFAATDLAVELLYLNEVNKAVIQESRDLNLRLLSAKSQAEEDAHTDLLTGLLNRRGMETAMERYKSCRETFSLMNLDLDRFKQVNDTYGHAAGDAVLMTAAQALRAELRPADIVARFGGDEFVVLLHRQTDMQDLGQVAHRIIKRLEQPVFYEGHKCQISGSIGITQSVDYEEINPDQMLLDADRALYAAKNAGRAQFRFVREVGGAEEPSPGQKVVAAMKRAS